MLVHGFQERLHLYNLYIELLLVYQRGLNSDILVSLKCLIYLLTSFLFIWLTVITVVYVPQY